jgi:hypothetical protein
MSGTDQNIWLDKDEAAAKYPYYQETMKRLEAVLDLAQLQGVTGPEIASMMASLHARAVARLHPNEEQRARVINVFREALIVCQNDLERVTASSGVSHPCTSL